jgi:hypothetical protein
MTEQPPLMFAKCPKCDWLHVVIAASEPASSAKEFEQQAPYKRCGNPACRHSTEYFVAASESDTPMLSQLPTIPGCIADHLMH